jgi:hypothetical protein
MLQMPHLPDQLEMTPGSIGQKYSVADETACSVVSELAPG